MPSSEARDVIAKTLATWGFSQANGEWQIHLTDADKLLRALAEAGIKCVPANPSEMTLRMAHYQIEDCRENGCDDTALHVWQFILAHEATPTAPSPTEPKDKP